MILYFCYMENWKKIKGFEEYEINEVDGSIRDINNNIIKEHYYHNNKTVNLKKGNSFLQRKPYLLYFQTFNKSLYPILPSLKNEVWKHHPFIPNIQVSNMGRVKSTITETLLPYSDNGNGYQRIGINHKTFYVHRLVAETFLPNPDNKPEIDHINTDKTDNTVCINEDGSINYDKTNLRWVSHTENMNNPITNIKIKNYNCGFRLKNCQTQKWVCEFDLNDNFTVLWRTSTDAAKYYNVKNTAISNCLNGRTKTCCGKKWVYFSKLSNSDLIALASLD